VGKRILRQSTRLSAGIVPAGGWPMSRAVASCGRTKLTRQTIRAHYRHVTIGFADIADKRPGLHLTGELSAGRKVGQVFLD
jgi:hypothetical protein